MYRVSCKMNKNFKQYVNNVAIITETSKKLKHTKNDSTKVMLYSGLEQRSMHVLGWMSLWIEVGMS